MTYTLTLYIIYGVYLHSACWKLGNPRNSHGCYIYTINKSVDYIAIIISLRWYNFK